MEKNYETGLAMPTYQAGLLQSQAYRALGGFLNDCLQPFGVTTPEWSLLGLLHIEDGLRPSLISQQLGVRPPVATSMIVRLQQKKLVKKINDEKDKRAACIFLTPEGKELIQSVEKKLRPDMKSFLHDIPMEELQVYLKVLGRIALKLN